jgi:hypothetical protein
MTMDKNSFDQIAWRVGVGIISVEVRPNRFTAVDIPVFVVAEVTCTVFPEDEYLRTLQGRITVHIYDTKGESGENAF